MQSKLRLEPVWTTAWGRALWLAWFMSALTFAACGAGAQPAARFAIHQPAQPLADSLTAISRQTGRSLLFNPVLLDGRTARAISGQMSAEEAVVRLLQGTGLVLEERAGALVVRPWSTVAPAASQPAASVPSSLAPAPTTVALSSLERLAQAAPQPASDGGTDTAAPQAVPATAQKVEVTGTRLRRVESETALPVNVYTRAEIERSGQVSLTRFLSSLNEVSMGQGEGSFTGAVQGQGTVQLRGMPLGSTLVLVNGRRVQAVGSSGANYFNLNLLPLSAVERVEVVPVGSSAVYGGDALAGVVNIILRKNLDGMSLSARVSSGAGFGDGGISIGAGGSGERGGWMALGTYSTSTPLQTEERAFFRDADYRRFGGVDGRSLICWPGTVTSNSGANLPGLNATQAAIPVTVPGQPLTVQAFAATSGQANRCGNFAFNASATLVHAIETLGVHTSGYLNLSESLTGFGELTLSHEEARAQSEGLVLNNVLVPATNPNNPFGVPVRVSARLGPENGREAYERDTNFVRALAGLRGDLGAGWDFEGTASVSRDQGRRLTTNTIVNAARRTAALGAADGAASLNPFATGLAATDEVLRGIWTNDLRRNFGRKVLAGGFVRGPVMELPAGPVETIIGGEAAWDDYRSVQATNQFVTKRDTRALYGEVRAPLWKTDGAGAGPGWTLGALTLAARRDHYSDFGSADTFQGGLELRPLRTLLLRASGATSFKPPTLLQTNVQDTYLDITLNRFVDPARGNELITQGDYVRGTNPSLRPETGRALAVGALWEPEGANGARFGVTAWQVRIEDLIGLLPSETVLANEALFPGFVTRDPTVNGVPGRVTRLFLSESNFGFVQTRGLDLEAARSWQVPIGRLSLSASATRVTEYAVAIAPRVAAVDQLGTRYANYWTPKWKSRFSVGLDAGTWSVGLTSRYLGSYKDTPPNTRKLGGRWEHDLSARVDLLRAGLNLGQVKAASMSFAIVNATNVLPEYAGTILPYFDTSQGDWRGRYGTVRLSVDW